MARTPVPIFGPRHAAGFNWIVLHVLHDAFEFVVVSNPVVVTLSLPECSLPSEALVRFMGGVAFQAMHDLGKRADPIVTVADLTPRFVVRFVALDW